MGQGCRQDKDQTLGLFRLGIVGGPGAGKTSVLNQLARDMGAGRANVFGVLPLVPLPFSDPFDELARWSRAAGMPLPESRVDLQLELFWLQLLKELFAHYLHHSFVEIGLAFGIYVALYDITILNVLSWLEGHEIPLREYLQYALTRKQLLNPDLPFYPTICHYLDQLDQLLNAEDLGADELQLRVIECLMREYDMVLFLPELPLTEAEFNDGRRLDALDDRGVITERVLQIHKSMIDAGKVVTLALEVGRPIETDQVISILIKRIEAKILESMSSFTLEELRFFLSFFGTK